MKIRNLSSIIFLFIMFMLFGTTAFAGTGSSNSESFNVSVPTNIPIHIDEHGNAICPTDYVITNRGDCAIEITSITFRENDDWTFYDYSRGKEDIHNEPFDSKKFGISVKSGGNIFNSNSSTGQDQVILTSNLGLAAGKLGNDIPFTFDAICSRMTEAANVSNKFSIIYTVDTIDENELYFITDGAGTITGLTESGRKLESVVVPDEIKGVPIRSIRYSALCESSNLKTIFIPDTITEIQKYALRENKNLVDVRLPSNLTYIDMGMFEGCSSLESIVIPESVEIIDNNVFQNCTSLTSITLNNNVTSFGIGAFSGCTSLTDVYVPMTEERWKSKNPRIGSGNDYFINATWHFLEPAYAMLYTDGSMVFQRGNTPEKGKTLVESYTDFEEVEFDNFESVPWHSNRSSIKSVYFKDKIKPISTACWFSFMHNVTTYDVSNLDTSNVTDMSYMFHYCISLTSLDVSNFNTSNVVDMSHMFSLCRSLASLDVSNFNTSNVKDMNGMFCECRSLTSLDVSNFNTSNVKDMNGMFCECRSLTSLDVSSFNTSNVKDMNGMFCECRFLQTIYASDLWSTSNLDNTHFHLFDECIRLIGGNGTTYHHTRYDAKYACIDTPSTPGYFTYKPASTTTFDIVPVISSVYSTTLDVTDVTPNTEVTRINTPNTSNIDVPNTFTEDITQNSVVTVEEYNSGVTETMVGSLG